MLPAQRSARALHARRNVQREWNDTALRAAALTPLLSPRCWPAAEHVRRDNGSAGPELLPPGPCPHVRVIFSRAHRAAAECARGVWSERCYCADSAARSECGHLIWLPVGQHQFLPAPAAAGDVHHCCEFSCSRTPPLRGRGVEYLCVDAGPAGAHA